ncbi:hypothetical protein KW786_02765, partial [Candidatus Parcubacteria bacterium]|nr:hypothetical protein [Candidatus Parcubacteria bacterium]
MKKHVPEVSRDVQMAALRDSLLGHQAFGRVRGSGYDQLHEVISRLLDEAESPSDFLRMFDQWTGDLRVVGNKLAVLRRDGLADAEGELMSAFRDPAHVLTGETIPLHETVPVTILMLDPARTLAMIRWLIAGHWDNLNGQMVGEDDRDLTTKLFAAFPSLTEFTALRRKWGNYEGWDLLAALYKDVAGRFPIDREWRGLSPAHDIYNDHIELWGEGSFQRDGHRIEAPSNMFGFVIEAEQSEVLARFDRQQQAELATWQLHLPKALVSVWTDVARSRQYNKAGYGSVRIGFYPEMDHPRWCKDYPALTSVGVSAGLGPS